jgi:WD40 repeat protein
MGGQNKVLLYQSDSLELLGVLPFPKVSRLVFNSAEWKIPVDGGGRAGKEGHAILCDVKTGDRIATLGDEYDTVLAADVSSDLSRVALGGPGKQVKVYATSNGKLLHQMKKHTDWVLALEYSPDAVLLASGDRNGGLFVWEAYSGQEFYNLSGHRSAVTAVSWRADSDVLLSASEDGTIKLWEMQDGKQIKSWTAHDGGVLSAAFTHDGRVVSCGRDNLVTLWDAKNNKQRSLQITNDLPVRVTFSHDGKKVLATTFAGRVLVWDAADGKPAGELAVNPPTLAARITAAEKEESPEQTVKWKAAQFNVGVYRAREELQLSLQKQKKLLAEVEDCQAAVDQSTRDLDTTRAALSAATDKAESRQLSDKVKTLSKQKKTAEGKLHEAQAAARKV